MCDQLLEDLQSYPEVNMKLLLSIIAKFRSGVMHVGSLAARKSEFVIGSNFKGTDVVLRAIAFLEKKNVIHDWTAESFAFNCDEISNLEAQLTTSKPNKHQYERAQRLLGVIFHKFSALLTMQQEAEQKANNNA